MVLNEGNTVDHLHNKVLCSSSFLYKPQLSIKGKIEVEEYKN